MWGICCHKASVMKVWSSLEYVIPLYFRMKGECFSFQTDYLIATEEELDNELLWASRRRCSLAKGMTLQQIKALDRPFWSCLTATHVMGRGWVQGTGVVLETAGLYMMLQDVKGYMRCYLYVLDLLRP